MLERSSTSRPGSDYLPSAHERIQGQRISLSEQSMLAAVVVLVLLAASLPYLYAYLSQPDDRVFSGIVFNVPDNVQYLSWLRDHRTALLVPNRMTAEPNDPSLFNLLWLGLGRASELTGLSVAVLFHTLRVLVAVTALLALYPFCRLFTRQRAEQVSAYLMIACGSGLGWIWVVEKYWRGLEDVRFPLDLYVAEPNLFFNILAFPHFVIAALLIVGVFWSFLVSLEHRSWIYAGVAAGLALLLTLQHAYDLLIIGLVPAGALGLIALRDRRIPWFGAGALALIGLVATPPAAYFTLLTSRNPLWREVLAQFDNAGVFTPPPLHLVVLMGVPLILALAGIIWHGTVALRDAMRRPHNIGPARPGVAGAGLLSAASNGDLFLWAWLVVGFLLLYIPTDFQIHMLNTWQIPVALVAARTVYRQILPRLAPGRGALARAIPVLLVLALLPTNLYLTAWRILELSRHSAPYYLTRDEDAALTWLERQADAETVVLSGLQLGQFVPARSDARTFLGHWAQTVDFYSKRQLASDFFDGRTSDPERVALLRQFAITYVLFGHEERTFGDYDPARSPLFEPAFRSGDVTIFRVRGDRP